MPIIITPPGKKAIRVDRTRFPLEVDLQKYLLDNPQAVPLHEIKEEAQLLILESEAPTPVGPIDILAIDHDGEIYIIETKLYRNADKRHVLTQVLDYGAALWGLVKDPDEWLQQLDVRRISRKQMSLLELLEQEFGDSQSTIEGMKANLTSGSFHFLILMDQVHANLKNLIRYINENSRFSVYAVEVEYYEHDGYRILIPHLFGAESSKKAINANSGGRGAWDENTFFQDVQQKLTAEELEAIRKIYEYIKQKADLIAWGTGKGKGSFNPKVSSISARSLFTINSEGKFYLNYVWLNDNDYALQCGQLLKAKLEAIEPLGKEIRTTNRKYPMIFIADLVPYVDVFLQKMDEFFLACQELEQRSTP